MNDILIQPLAAGNPNLLPGFSATESPENEHHDNGGHHRGGPCVVPRDAVRSGNETDYPEQDEQCHENLPKSAVTFF